MNDNVKEHALICEEREKLKIYPQTHSSGRMWQQLSQRLFRPSLLTVCATLAALSIAPNALAQTELIGTGNPAIDVAAVQAAIDQGGIVLLKGTFSFTGVAFGSPHRVVTVTNSVRVAGVIDEQGEMPLIVNGERPFFVAAPGADVTFEGLRFQTPQTVGISIASVGELRIANCKFNGLVPGRIGTENVAIAILSSGGPFGTLSVIDNEIDGQATLTNSTNGIILTGPTQAIEIADNIVKNTSAHGIDLRNVVGDAHVDRNRVITGPLGRGGGIGQFVDAMRCIGPGNYLVEDNSFDFGFENGAGIRLGGTTGAVVRANRIAASLSDDVTPGPQSAAIQVEGTCSTNVVLNNQIDGRARVAFSVIHSDFPLDKGTGTGDPQDTSFVGNEHQLFNASMVDVEIGPVAAQSLIVGGTGTIVDFGIGTIVKGGYQTLSGDRFQSVLGAGEQTSNAEEIWTQYWPDN